MSDAPVELIPLGAIIKSFKVKGLNIVDGFPTEELYAKHNSPFFGATIGRVANRIHGAKINDLNGKTWPLSANLQGNTLHGGKTGWSKKVWDGPKPVGIRQIPGVDGLRGGESVQFSLHSEDGDEGFPGAVDVTTTYTSGTQQVDGKEVIVLGIEYEANLVGGADETAINMTNHSYFNLSGDETIDGTVVTLPTTNYLPVDAQSIPTGGPTTWPNLDTTKEFTLGATGPSFDNCFTTTTDPASVPIDTRSQPLLPNVTAHHPKTGIHLQVLSTEPSFQFYTGEGTNVPEIEGQRARGARSSFCCEPGRWANACNVPEWKSMSVLKKGETYGCRIVYKAWSD